MKSFLDDKYIAENYYKGFEGEQSLLFEKDGTISKLARYDYKTHKFQKNTPPPKKQSKSKKKSDNDRRREETLKGPIVDTNFTNDIGGMIEDGFDEDNRARK